MVRFSRTHSTPKTLTNPYCANRPAFRVFWASTRQIRDIASTAIDSVTFATARQNVSPGRRTVARDSSFVAVWHRCGDDVARDRRPRRNFFAMIDVPSPLRRVCIVMMSAVGDAVHVLPVINALKRHSPDV